METKQTEKENEITRKELGFENGECWSAIVTGKSRAGGVSLWWREGLQVTVMSGSLNHIDSKIDEDTYGTWRFLGIYGWPEGSEKWLTWELLRSLAGQWEGPWLCGGDLNQVLTEAEKEGGNRPSVTEMWLFNDCLLDRGVQDLGFQGYKYTWDNSRGQGGFIEERMDRFVGSDAWSDKFQDARVLHLDKRRSNHRPIICDSLGEEDVDPAWGRSFRFDPIWAKHGDCAHLIQQAWQQGGMNDICSKLQQCREQLGNGAWRPFRTSNF
ncbi:unnamed protein product [Linum trigynum]|uniref:Uncharacterized protein n=1 Tax=Linum trigynum TaxID=586398 RepID=A0AAV2G456_9ROSI